MKTIKTTLRNRMGEKSLSHLMNISIESPEKLSDSDLEKIVDLWNRKHKRMYIMIHNTELYNLERGGKSFSRGGKCPPPPPPPQRNPGTDTVNTRLEQVVLVRPILLVQTSSGHVISLGANINMYVYQPSELGI